VGVVVEGTIDSTHVFKTSRLMVNHSNEYRPPKNDQELKEMMKNMSEGTSASR
jgi:cytochrome c-type biogenesis protein CcmE